MFNLFFNFLNNMILLYFSLPSLPKECAPYYCSYIFLHLPSCMQTFFSKNSCKNFPTNPTFIIMHAQIQANPAPSQALATGNNKQQIRITLRKNPIIYKQRTGKGYICSLLAQTPLCSFHAGGKK